MEHEDHPLQSSETIARTATRHTPRAFAIRLGLRHIGRYTSESCKLECGDRRHHLALKVFSQTKGNRPLERSPFDDKGIDILDELMMHSPFTCKPLIVSPYVAFDSRPTW